MRTRRLQTRFILAGALLVLTTVGSSVWSAWNLARLSAVVDDTLRDSQSAIDLTTALAGSLEREDDALLLAVSGNADMARNQMTSIKQQAESQYQQLLSVLRDDALEEQSLARQLRHEIDEYRQAGSDLIATAGKDDALQRYHERVNPLLRELVATCAKIREANFKEMQQAGVRARDEAGKATLLVITASVAAVVLASVIAFWLARSILLPVRELTGSVEALRQGDFDRRVKIGSIDELGQLAAGFNRMAESLADYRRSSLGELLAAKATLEATLNALPDAVFVIDPDGRLVAINLPGKAVLEATQAAQAGHLEELPLLPEHRESVAGALGGSRDNGSRMDFSRTLPVTLAGRPHKFLVRSAPIPEFFPRRTGAVVVLDDVTEFARLDELRGELIGVASHELKTPLTTLSVNLLLLGEEANTLTARQQEIVAAAVTGCEELSGTIEELLDVTRIEAGQLRLNLGPVDVYDLLDRVLRPLQTRFDDGRVQVRVERASTPAIVRGDAQRLSLVFANLLTNALKYSPADGTIGITVMSGQNTVPGDGLFLQIAVTDSGPGIPAEFRERVFEKFFRVEHHLAQDHAAVRGTGIGLYLCREIINAHGGSIRCEARDHGVGTRFVISLPAVA
ncbi:MAG TPA: ATP-binding protein [Pirellulales bacterium]|nr:ATP-binding protein [Pirellulales bacterium]